MFDKLPSVKRVIGVTIGIWFLVGLLTYLAAMHSPWGVLSPKVFEVSATIGDTFGTVNALFSGLALVFLAYALLLQHKDIEGQGEQLDAQKSQFDRQLTQLESQLEELRKQRLALDKSAEAQDATRTAMTQQVELAKETADAAIRPVLAFSRRSSVWQLENVGPGAALNVKVRDEKDEKVEVFWCFPLASRAETLFEWGPSGGSLEAWYTDANGVAYYTKCYQNKNETKRLETYPDDPKPTKSEKHLRDQNKKADSLGMHGPRN